MAKTKPTPEDIKTEIARLQEMKPRVRQFSLFGDDNHEAIDLQVTTLQEILDGRLTDPCDALDKNEHLPSHARDAAYEAALWAFGEEPDSASASWESLVS
jgi:hypothetical protein